MGYADYDYYINVFLGKSIGGEDFPRLAERASDYVRGVTRGISDTVGGRGGRDALQKAVCAVAEVFFDEERLVERGFSGGAALASETVGSWSRSYRDPAVSDSEIKLLADRKWEAVRVYLAGVPCFQDLFGVRSYPCLHRHP